MTRRRAGGSGSHKVRTTIVAGVAGGLVGAVVRILARRARSRREQGELAFSRASDGLWPPVPRAEERSVQIAADRATGDGAGDLASAETAGVAVADRTAGEPAAETTEGAAPAGGATDGTGDAPGGADGTPDGTDAEEAG